jgi:hypothetical protein
VVTAARAARFARLRAREVAAVLAAADAGRVALSLPLAAGVLDLSDVPADLTTWARDLRAAVLAAILTRPIVTADAARGYLLTLHAVGASYHPDDGAADMVTAHGAPLFTAEDAARADARMREVSALLPDPCLVLLAACRDGLDDGAE